MFNENLTFFNTGKISVISIKKMNMNSSGAHL